MVLPFLLWLLLFGAAIVHADGPPEAENYRVKSLPGTEHLNSSDIPEMHAGHITLHPENHTNLFFWRVGSRNPVPQPKLILWLNGGPGCSSLDGALMEIGPFRAESSTKLRPNPGSWHENSNLLFLDQPAGTGFSFTDSDAYLHDLPEAADQFLQFLDKYLQIFPEDAELDLYLAGESYAGQYIPYFASALLSRNRDASAGSARYIRLAGVLIGNGWIDPTRQSLSFIPFAFDQGLLDPSADYTAELTAQYGKCERHISAEVPQSANRKIADSDANSDSNSDSESKSPNVEQSRVSYPECDRILDLILQFSRRRGPANEECTNVYDTRLRDSYPSCGMNWPPDLTSVTPYLSRDDVQKALNLHRDFPGGWAECSGQVSTAFTAMHSVPAIELLSGVVAEVPVMLFSGDRDVICNHYGTEEMLKYLQWNGRRGFSGAAEAKPWWVAEGSGEGSGGAAWAEAGKWQTERNMTYVLVSNSSHMVPFDFPGRSRAMMEKFVGLDESAVRFEPPKEEEKPEEKPEESEEKPEKPEASEEAENPEESESEAEAEKTDGGHSGAVLLVAVCIAGVAGTLLFAFCVTSRKRNTRDAGGNAEIPRWLQILQTIWPPAARNTYVHVPLDEESVPQRPFRLSSQVAGRSSAEFALQDMRGTSDGDGKGEAEAGKQGGRLADARDD